MALLFCYPGILGLFLLSTLLITFLMCSSKSKVLLLTFRFYCYCWICPVTDTPPYLEVSAPLDPRLVLPAYIEFAAIMLRGVCPALLVFYPLLVFIIWGLLTDWTRAGFIPMTVLVLSFFLAFGVLLFDTEPPPPPTVPCTAELTNLASFLL